MTVSDVSSITNGIARMATTPSDMFFLWAGGPGGGSAIGHCPIAGCPSAGAPAIIRTSTMTFTDMTAAGSDVFWIDGGALRTCSAASCAAPRDLATGLVGADYLVVDGSFVYWIEGANGPSGAIERVAL